MKGTKRQHLFQKLPIKVKIKFQHQNQGSDFQLNVFFFLLIKVKVLYYLELFFKKCHNGIVFTAAVTMICVCLSPVVKHGLDHSAMELLMNGGLGMLMLKLLGKHSTSCALTQQVDKLFDHIGQLRKVKSISLNSQIASHAAND